MCCSVLQSVAECCSALLFVAVSCSGLLCLAARFRTRQFLVQMERGTFL